MGYIEIPTRSINDLNSAADINQLMLNDKELKSKIDVIETDIPLIESSIASVGDGIIESGSNSNGRYVKFRDGTMIQWGESTLTWVASTSAAGVTGFPFAFIYPPTYSWFMDEHFSGVNFADEYNPTPVSAVQGFPYGIMRGNEIVSGTKRYRWKAIGRWKA